ncbi:MAG: hypothetical protein HKN11_16830, partial [Rhizobiales bacterium]|nr:hypothetical protein [Hyphomicrobiales bacterium]
MRRLLTVMGIAALALVGALSLPFVAAQNQTAQGLVEGMLQDILSSEGRRVVVEDVAISIDGDVTASRIEIHDGAGVWLVMEKFSLDWQPLSLLSSSLKIDSLSVDRIGIQRLPESSDAKAETPAELTGLQDADIAKVTISKFEISEHLVDDEFTFKIEGSGSIKQTPPEVKLELQADRTNGGDSQLLAKLLLDPLSRNLDVDLRLQESSSGLVVNLLNIDDEPAVDLSVTAKGTIENWAGQFALKLNDRDVIGGTSEIRTVADGRRLTINADGEVGPFLSPQIAAFFDDSTQLTGSVLFQPGKSQASVERIRLGNELVQLRASGPVDWSGTTTNLAVELRSHDERSLVLSRTEGSLGDISASDLDADLLITGSLQAPKWTLSGSAQDLTSDAAQLTNLSVKLQGTGFAPGLVDFTAGGEISAEIAAGKSNLLPKALTGQAQIRFSAKTDEERRLSLSDTTLTIGSAKMALDGHALPHNGTFDVGFNASTSSPSTGRLLFDRLLQGDVRLAGRIAKNETGRLALSNWRVNGEKLSAALQGGVDEASLDLTLKADLLDLSGLHADATGSANLTATLKGARAAPELEFLAIGKGVTLMGTPFTEPRLEAKVKLSADRPAGDLTFTGKLQDLPVRAHAVLETAPDGTRALRDLSVASGSARLDGELSLPSAGPPTGRLKLAAPNLRDVAPLLLMQLAGSLSADINLERTGDIGRLRAKFSGADITSEGFAVKTVAGDVLIDDLLGRPKAQGDI